MAEAKRTPEELQRPEYNYYIAFRIDPKEKDVAKIDQAIKQDKNKWTNGTPQQRRYLELWADIQSVMGNDASRAQELANAKKLKLGEAIKLITSMAANKGRLYKSELQVIVKAEKFSWFMLDELEKEAQELTKQGIKYIDDTQSRIDFNKYKDVEKLLISAKKASIYELLGTTSSASVAEIASCITNTYSNLKKRVGAEGTAVDKILGIAKIIFKTEESKKQYDDFLALKDDVWDQLELRQSHGIKEISLDEFYMYAEKIKATLKINFNEVEELLAAGLKQYAINVVGTGDAKDDSGDVINLEECPYPDCGRGYRVSASNPPKSCPHCGKPLEILCWNCAGKMPFTTKSKTCPTCGGTAQTKTMFNARMEEVEKLLRLPTCSVIDLRSALATLKNVIPNYSKQPSSLANKKITEYEQTITKKIRDEEVMGSAYKKDNEAIQQQIVQKNYQRALSLALTLRKTYPSYNTVNTTNLINDINKYLKSAQAFVDQAKPFAAQNNETQVILLASKALEVCADHGEARQLLQKFKPQPPANLRASVSGGKVIRVEWNKVGDQNMVTYTVIKKVGSRPTNHTDGTVVASNLTLNFYEDNTIVAATPYYYAVYADRCEITSDIVPCAAPIQILLDVSNVQQELATDGVTVKWDTPHNVKAIEVWKKDGPVAPTNPGDGTRVSAVTKEGFKDPDNSGTCSYLIICQYEINGKPMTSAGISRVFKRFVPLAKLEKVSIEAQPTGEFMLKCELPRSGKVSIVYSKDRLTCRLDTIQRVMEFNTLCKGATNVPVTVDADQHLVFKLPQNQVLWAYPMISNDQLFMLAAPVLLNTLDGIKNISYTETNGTVVIKGAAPAGIKNVVVKISNNKFPLDVADEGDRMVVPVDRFQSEGAIIKLKADSLNYISVFTEIVANGQTSYTRAVPIGDEPISNLRKKSVQYCIECTPSAAKRFTVTVKFAADEEVEIPRLCLMKGIPRPLDKSSGELVEKLEPITLKKGFFSKVYTGKQTITVNPDSIKVRFAIFFDDEKKKTIQFKEVQHL